METDGAAALSAFVTGIAAAGAVAGLRIRAPGPVRWSLAVVFAMFAGVCAVPLVAAHAFFAYTLYMPAVLPMLIALPISVHRHAQARIGASYRQPARQRDATLIGVGLLVTAGYWLLPAPDRAAMFVDGRLPGGLFPSGLALVTFVLVLGWAAVSLAYLVATARALRRHRAALKAVFSNTDTLELRWLDGFLGLLVALWAASALAVLGDNLGGAVRLPGEAVLILAGATLLALIGMAISPGPVEPGDMAAQLRDAGPESKYERSALTAERAETIARRIEAAMRAAALYRDPSLSLQKLARHVAAPTNLVSQVLNEHLHASFFDYVARWRIEAAKPLLVQGGASVLAIALEVGFNTRSTFYKAFKRETGSTPKAYVKAAGSTPDAPPSIP